MTQTVKVRLRKPPRVFTFLCRNVALNRNDPCIVRSDRGLEFGVCVLPPEEAASNVKERYKMSVVRKATHHDQLTHTQIQDDEERAKEKCAEKIAARELAMKLVECEYSFDRRKIIFYFTAEDRVDFRELVRDLAKDLKTRIELRHIQVRDEAKMIGGIGTCGRELCCTTWMKDFMPISMRMAKQQNLSLNPSKISGQCGRLMCCLSYENEMYKQEKKRAKAAMRPDPAALEKIRDRMEDNAPVAAEVLKGSSLQDVGEGASRRDGGRKRTERPAQRESGPKRTEPDAARKPDAQQASETDQVRSGAPTRKRRRRRGRRKGGAGKSGGNGSSST